MNYNNRKRTVYIEFLTNELKKALRRRTGRPVGEPPFGMQVWEDSVSASRDRGYRSLELCSKGTVSFEFLLYCHFVPACWRIWIVVLWTCTVTFHSTLEQDTSVQKELYCWGKTKFWGFLIRLSLVCSLCSYVWEHLEVGYVQGMCDLLAPLMVILDNGRCSAGARWCV